MKQDDEVTPVVFRRERRKDGEVTAVMPCEPADCNGRYTTCYAHVGQHGSASMLWYYTTRAAKPDEYADLLKELESLGYRVKVYKRIQPFMRDRFHRLTNSNGAL
jgi:hypothetical protein